MQRFDEIELQAVPLPDQDPLPAALLSDSGTDAAPRFRRMMAVLTDLSLVVALALALAPLLPSQKDIAALGALAAFVLLASYYYFAGSWLLSGKTVGGTIFDVRVIDEGGSAMSLRAASLRFLGLCLSLLSGGLGLMLALLPSRRSLPDRLSATRVVSI